jgi:hypothetical protein
LGLPRLRFIIIFPPGNGFDPYDTPRHPGSPRLFCIIFLRDYFGQEQKRPVGVREVKLNKSHFLGLQGALNETKQTKGPPWGMKCRRRGNLAASNHEKQTVPAITVGVMATGWQRILWNPPDVVVWHLTLDSEAIGSSRARQAVGKMKNFPIRLDIETVPAIFVDYRFVIITLAQK